MVSTNFDEERRDSTRYGLAGGDRVEKASEDDGMWGSRRGGGTNPDLRAATSTSSAAATSGSGMSGYGSGGGGGSDKKEREGGGGGGGLFTRRPARAARGAIPPPIETRVLPVFVDDREPHGRCVGGGRRV